MFNRIVNGRVVAQYADLPLVDPNAIFVEGIANVGDRYSAGQFVAYVPTPQEFAQTEPARIAEVQAQIDALELKYHLNRAVREALLGLAVKEALAQGVDEPTLYALNAGYRKTKDLDAQIATLRGQL